MKGLPEGQHARGSLPHPIDIISYTTRNRKEQDMQTFFMFGKYQGEAVKSISTQRTQKVSEVVKKLGGRVQSMHALLGGQDLVFIVELPDNNKALKASVDLAKATGIGFTTSPAVTVEEFDKLVG
jgi:uncharacterized protein with GYD domain